MRTCLIVNPSAGAGTGLRRLLAAAAGFRGLEVAITGGPGDAERLAARAAAAGFHTVAAAGGDGTVAEVAAGLLTDHSEVRLGVIPLGTGNDLARGLGLPRRPAAALELLRAPGSVPLDVVRIGEAGGGWMVNAAIAGLAGGIGRRLGAATKRRLGALAYPAAALRELGRLAPRRVSLLLEETELVEVEALMVVVSNGPCAGGGIPLAPTARPDDGVLDIMVVPAMSGAALAAVVPRILLGRHGASRRLVFRRARRLRLELEPPSELDVDGETRPGGPLSLEVVAGALRVAAPPPRAGR